MAAAMLLNDSNVSNGFINSRGGWSGGSDGYNIGNTLGG
jgi:hypothetical protein